MLYLPPPCHMTVSTVATHNGVGVVSAPYSVTLLVAICLWTHTGIFGWLTLALLDCCATTRITTALQPVEWVSGLCSDLSGTRCLTVSSTTL